MAVQAGTGLFFQSQTRGGSGILGFNITLIDSANESQGNIIRVPKSGTIDAVGVRTSTITTGATLSISLETTLSGRPSGTPWSTASTAMLTVNESHANKFFQVSLSSSAVVTSGDLLALVIKMPATSAGNLQMAAGPTGATPGFPFLNNFQGGVTSRVNIAPNILLFYSDSSIPIIPGVNPFDTFAASASFSTTTNPAERGMRYTFPYSLRVAGLWSNLAQGSSDSHVQIIAYDADTTTILATTTLAPLVSASNAQRQLTYTLFPSPVTFHANSTHIVTFRAISSGVITLDQFTVSSSNYMQALESGSSAFVITRSNAGGGWTINTTSGFLMGIIIDGAGDSSSGGGASGIQTITNYAFL